MSQQRIGTAVLEFMSEDVEIKKSLADLEKRVASAKTKFAEAGGGVEAFGEKMKAAGKQTTSLGTSMSIGLTAPILAAGAVIFSAGTTIKESFDTIRQGTGATGEALAGLEGSFRAVFKGVPNDAAEVAAAIADLNTRTGATGPALEGLATQLLTLSRITGTQVGPLIASTTRLFGDWAVSTEDQSGALDYLWKVSQSTGVSFDTLSTQLVQFGAPLRAMGFSIEESAAMLGKWEKEGVNTELVMGSLRIAANTFSKEGVGLREGLKQTIERIQGMGSASQATAEAARIFGSRAGVDMAAAIREGRFSVDELMATLKDSPETIATTAAATDDFSEKWKAVKNSLTVALEPLGTRLLNVLDQLTPMLLGVVEHVASLAEWFGGLSPTTQTVILAIGGLVAAIGPVLIVVGSLISAIGTIAPVVGTVAGVLGGLISGPLLLIVGAIGAVVAAWYYWDDITAIVKNVYTGVKTWIADKLGGIFDTLKGKIDTVKGYFAGLYDAVVGHSFVPDMVQEIGQEIARLDGNMVKPTEKATTAAEKAFQKLNAEVGKFGGRDAILAGQDLVKVLERMGGPLKVLPSQLGAMQTTLEGAAEGARTMGNARLAELFESLATQVDPLTVFQQKYNVAIGEYVPLADTAAAATNALYEQMYRLSGQTTTIPANLRSVSMDLGKLTTGFRAAVTAIPPKGKWESAWGGMKDGLSGVLDSVPDTLVSAFTGGGDIMGAIKGIATQIGSTIGGSIGAAFGPLGEKIGGAIGSLLGPLAGKVGGFLKGLFGGVSAEVKAARAEVADFQRTLNETATATQRNEAAMSGWGDKGALTLIQVRDALVATGRSAGEADALVKALWDTDHPEAAKAAMEQINAVLGEQKDLLESAKNEATDLWGELLDAAGDASVQIPEDIKLMVDRMAELGAITEQQALNFRNLTDGTLVNVKAMETAATDLGLDFSALGPAYQQAKLDEKFADLFRSIKTVEVGTNDFGLATFSAKEEIQALVDKSLEYGTTIPANMRPYLEALIEGGNLTDANGQKLTDIGQLNFAEPVVDKMTQIADRLTAVLEKLSGVTTVMGADMPDAAKRASDTIVGEFDGRATDAVKRLGDAINDTIEMHSPTGLEGMAHYSVLAADAIEGLSTRGAGAMTILKTAVDTVAKGIGEDVSGAVNTANQQLSDLMSRMSFVRSEVAGATSQGGDVLKPRAMVTRDQAAEMAQAVAKELGRGPLSQDQLNMLAGRFGLKDGENAIPVDDVQRFLDEIRSLMSVAKNGIFPMASGGSGLVTRPTLFLAGEAGAEQFAFSGAGRRFSDVADPALRAELQGLRRDLISILPRLSEQAARHGAQTAGRRR